MIEEMTSEDFPRPSPLQLLPRPPAVPGLLAPIDKSREELRAVQTNLANNMTPQQMPTFELPFSTEPIYNIDSMGAEAENTSAEEFLSFPGMFDYETW